MVQKKEQGHFANYDKWLNKVIKVEVHFENWLLSKCSCAWFKKTYICCHVIGLSIRLGLCEAPLVAQNVELGQHRGVGRLSQVKSAYLEQNTNYTSQFCRLVKSNVLAETETPIVNDVPIIEKKKLADHQALKINLNCNYLYKFKYLYDFFL